VTARHPARTPPPIHGGYARALRGLGELLVARTGRPEAVDPPDGPRGRILPMIGGILQGRQALRDSDRPRAVESFADGAFHLALIAAANGDPHLRLLEALRAQRQRYEDCRGRHRVPWWDHPPKHHFDRLIANALAAVYEIDARRPDRRRLRTHAADAANYALFFLQTSRVRLPRPSSRPLAPTHEIQTR
jgi:hypothetical protein